MNEEEISERVTGLENILAKMDKDLKALQDLANYLEFKAKVTEIESRLLSEP